MQKGIKLKELAAVNDSDLHSLGMSAPAEDGAPRTEK